MTPGTIGIIGVVVLFICLFSGMPIAFIMAVVGFLGFSYLVSVEAALSLLARDFFGTLTSYSFTVIPMFMLMGHIAFYSGVSTRLYGAAYTFFGRLPGGLAITTIAGCAGFAAICGSTTASVATMATVSLPEMKRYNYDPALATGSVAAGGLLGTTIPPSVIFILYGIMTRESIAKLFMAGILPGILEAFLFVAAVYIMCRLNPRLGPGGAGATLREKLASLSGIVEVLLLFIMIMGGLFTGLFTPTEAGAVGAGGALLIALARRKLTWQGFTASLVDTTRTTAMVFLLLVGATVFGHFLSVTRIPFEIADWVGGLPLPPVAIMGVIIFIYLIAGCVIEILPLILITVPIFFPIIQALGFNPLLFGVIIVLTMDIGALTPPMAIAPYIVSRIATDVPLTTIFRGVLPFLAALIVGLVIVIAFPQIALFLPSLMR